MKTRFGSERLCNGKRAAVHPVQSSCERGRAVPKALSVLKAVASPSFWSWREQTLLWRARHQKKSPVLARE